MPENTPDSSARISLVRLFLFVVGCFNEGAGSEGSPAVPWDYLLSRQVGIVGDPLMGASKVSDQSAPAGRFLFYSNPSLKQASLCLFIKQKSRSKLRD